MMFDSAFVSGNY